MTMPSGRWFALAVCFGFGELLYATSFVPPIVDAPLGVFLQVFGVCGITFAGTCLLAWTFPRRFWEVTAILPGRDEPIPGGVALYCREKRARATANRLNAQMARDCPDPALRPVYVVRELFKCESLETEPSARP